MMSYGIPDDSYEIVEIFSTNDICYSTKLLLLDTFSEMTKRAPVTVVIRLIDLILFFYCLYITPWILQRVVLEPGIETKTLSLCHISLWNF